MATTRIGILSFSDGRRRVHEGLKAGILAHEERIRAALTALGVEPVAGQEVIHAPRLAVAEARRLVAADVAGVVLNIPVFAFPNLSVIAADILARPLAILSPGEPGLPGLGGLLAAGGALEQAGHDQERMWGPLDEPSVRRRLAAFARAAGARHALRGQVYGQIGGRSIGMLTGVASSPADWHRRFGVDMDHADQSEILRLAAEVPPAERERAVAWLERHVGRVAYGQSPKLTRESLGQQAACAMAVKRLVAERQFDFIAIQCHYDLSEHHSTQCLSAALLPSVLDWDGPRAPLACACEADGDGALTMQVLQLVSGLPPLFMDLRHYDAARGLWTMCNCGGQSVYYSLRDDEPARNLMACELVPVIPKYGGSGAHVRYVACAGELTFARLMHDREGPCLLLFRGASLPAEPAWTEASCPCWPHAFVRAPVEPAKLIDALHANHVHAVAGDWVEEMRRFARLTGLRLVEL